MLRAFSLSLEQMASGRMLLILLVSSLISVALFAGLWFGLDRVLDGIDPAGWPGWLRWAWTRGQDAGGIVLAILAGVLLFPAVATAVMGLFLDFVVDAVEARHYPQARAVRSVGLVQGLGLALGSGLRMLLWNLAALPAYLALLFTAVGPIVLFMAINGVLLGRDLFQLVALRHLPPDAERTLRRENRGAVTGLGVAASLLYLVPVLNLLAPLLGAAMATHMVHRALVSRI
ncbi:MAG: hypothetical protein E6R12_14160 [Sphingomonadales bacterium]|nr:MAG: hypothetical protein E6R12_14160 [Sphingomonadales bacterium]